MINLDDSGNVKEYQEKPCLTFMVSMGISILSNQVLQYIPRNGWLDLPDLVTTLIKHNEKVTSYLFDGIWLDVGTHETFKKASVIMSKNSQLFCLGRL